MLVPAPPFLPTTRMTDELHAPLPQQGSAAGAATARETPPESVSPLILLVEQMASGRQDALSRLYDETSPLINGLLLRMLELPQDTEEALLDVYMKAWKNAASYSQSRGSVQSWLVIMARSIAIDRIRHKGAQPKTAGLEFKTAVEFVSPGASPEEHTADSQRRAKVQALLRELPAEQRQLVEMAFFGGYSHSELAEILGQPLGTVKSRIRMALGKLRTVLEEGN
jgi:RNA polymerase sigma-70 factor (ECF subfamily)